MWNGFSGDGGHRLTELLTIPMAMFACSLYSLLHLHEYSLWITITHLMSSLHLLVPSVNEILYYIYWMILSWMLYLIVPGNICNGPINNSGNTYKYKLNSLNCLFVLSCIQLILGWYNILPIYLLSQYYHRIVIVSIWMGLLMTILAYLKGKLFPTYNNAESQGRSNFLDDFYSGIELVPRWSSSSTLDIKLFTVGHIGMILWQLINTSHAFYGLYFGNNLDAMIICLLQFIYIVDWAWNERWYLFTIDMQHDRLGFYLTYGGFTWMSCIYTAYGYYSSHVNILSTFPSSYYEILNLRIVLICLLYIFGYWLMRTSNNQKENFRRNLTTKIWGSFPKYITVNYKTVDGIHHSNKLLLSGFWGWSRHFNYVGDIILCLSLSIICGFDSLWAHVYTIQMIILLITRAHRDDLRCSRKYGVGWDEYIRKNPYLLIPYIY
jgi:7-dehydrocholesterol reductase